MSLLKCGLLYNSSVRELDTGVNYFTITYGSMYSVMVMAVGLRLECN